MSTSPLEEAIQKAGNQVLLAEQITKAAKASLDPKMRRRRFKQQHVSWWLVQSQGVVPAEVAPLIEAATGIPREKLRPDVFGRVAA